MGNPLRLVGVNRYTYYPKHGYQYAIVHSEKYQVFFKPGSKKAVHFPSFAKFYKTLFQQGELIKEFSPNDGNRPGPTVRIYKF